VTPFSSQAWRRLKDDYFNQITVIIPDRDDLSSFFDEVGAFLTDISPSGDLRWREVGLFCDFFFSNGSPPSSV